MDDGSQSRDFTYATDIARGTIAALKPQGCNVINLGSGTRNTLAEALKIIEKCVKNSAIIYHEPLQRTDVASTQADIGTARELNCSAGSLQSSWMMASRKLLTGMNKIETGYPA